MRSAAKKQLLKNRVLWTFIKDPSWSKAIGAVEQYTRLNQRFTVTASSCWILVLLQATCEELVTIFTSSVEGCRGVWVSFGRLEVLVGTTEATAIKDNDELPTRCTINTLVHYWQLSHHCCHHVHNRIRLYTNGALLLRLYSNGRPHPRRRGAVEYLFTEEYFDNSTENKHNRRYQVALRKSRLLTHTRSSKLT